MLILLFLLLYIGSSLSPELEECSDIVHAVVGVEECSHRVEQVLIVMQILLLADLVQLELLLDVLILQGGIPSQVLDQLLQQVARLRLLLALATLNSPSATIITIGNAFLLMLLLVVVMSVTLLLVLVVLLYG